MDNSESVRVDGVDGGFMEEQREVRKYSREQLFELAKSIEGLESIADDLESMRHADWTQYNLDTLPDERLLSANFLSRQNSELAERELDLSGQQHRKLYRMTSSPSIRGAKLHDVGQPLVSSQARVKYARLIETMSNGTGQLGRAPARQPLGRISSHNTRPLPERPGQLFGPLRRQASAHEGVPSSGPEEPMSLPYSINISGRQRESPRWSRAEAEGELEPTPAASLLDDETPIKRIGGSKANSNEQDDDDFDITSLLSITVLSDIRTIRQDLHTYGRQTSQLSSRPAVARSKSHEPNSRMPPRSKTALDFNYEPRQPHRPTPQQQLAAAVASSCGAQTRRPIPPTAPAQYFPAAPQSASTYSHPAYQTAPSSLAPVASLLAADWRAPPSSLFVCAQMAPPASASKQAQQPAKAKPVDESVAKIIESFKAQVRARAADEAPVSAAQETRPQATKPQAGQTGRGRSKSPDGQINGAAANESRSSGEPASSAPRSPAKSPAEPETGTAAAAAAVAAGSKLDNEASGHANEPTASYKSRASHIPRLVALQQRAKSNQNAAAGKVTAAQDAQKDAKAPSASAPGKFVSQYKRLRGKSLADEVAECKSPA